MHFHSAQKKRATSCRSPPSLHVQQINRADISVSRRPGSAARARCLIIDITAIRQAFPPMCGQPNPIHALGELGRAPHRLGKLPRAGEVAQDVRGCVAGQGSDELPARYPSQSGQVGYRDRVATRSIGC